MVRRSISNPWSMDLCHLCLNQLVYTLFFYKKRIAFPFLLSALPEPTILQVSLYYNSTRHAPKLQSTQYANYKRNVLPSLIVSCRHLSDYGQLWQAYANRSTPKNSFFLFVIVSMFVYKIMISCSSLICNLMFRVVEDYSCFSFFFVYAKGTVGVLVESFGRQFSIVCICYCISRLP